MTDIRYTIQEANQNISGSAGRTPEYQKPGIEIYDVSGRLVKSFDHESTIRWDGTDQSNRQLGSGVYFVKLTSGEFEETRKVLLVR
jgi:flagellar hook assembly protein FlgD